QAAGREACPCHHRPDGEPARSRPPARLGRPRLDFRMTVRWIARTGLVQPPYHIGKPFISVAWMTPLSHRVFALEQAPVHLIEFGHLVCYSGAPRAGARGSRHEDRIVR